MVELVLGQLLDESSAILLTRTVKSTCLNMVGSINLPHATCSICSSGPDLRFLLRQMTSCSWLSLCHSACIFIRNILVTRKAFTHAWHSVRSILGGEFAHTGRRAYRNLIDKTDFEYYATAEELNEFVYESYV